MTVKDIMTPQPVMIKLDETVTEAARKMKSLDVGFLPVGEGTDVVGVITDRDITIRCTAEGKNPDKEKVKDHMTKRVESIFINSSPEEARAMMSRSKIRRLMVVDDSKKPVGVLALGDLVVDAGSKLAGEALKDISKPSEPDR